MLKSLLAKKETNDINPSVGKEDTANADNINDTIIEDTELLQEQLKKIISACANYDDTAAISAADLLLKKQWKTYIIEKLEEIKTAVFSDSDFDKALGIAKELRKM